MICLQKLSSSRINWVGPKLKVWTRCFPAAICGQTDQSIYKEFFSTCVALNEALHSSNLLFSTAITCFVLSLVWHFMGSCNEKFVAAAELSIAEDPNSSLCYWVQELWLCPSTLRKILGKYLGIRSYKIQLVHWLKLSIHQVLEWW